MSAFSNLQKKPVLERTALDNSILFSRHGEVEKAAEILAAMQARIDRLEAGIRRIINGEYDNARTILAAEKFARELLRGDE